MSQPTILILKMMKIFLTCIQKRPRHPKYNLRIMKRSSFQIYSKHWKVHLSRDSWIILTQNRIKNPLLVYLSACVTMQKKTWWQKYTMSMTVELSSSRKILKSGQIWLIRKGCIQTSRTSFFCCFRRHRLFEKYLLKDKKRYSMSFILSYVALF